MRQLRDQDFLADAPLVVSVAIIAYNVEPFIREAIESVLDQVVDFRVEVVIGEDCSQDGTRGIASEHTARHPGIASLPAHEHNQGLRPNSVATQNACRGSYIALCDGDDYWTDTGKLSISG